MSSEIGSEFELFTKYSSGNCRDRFLKGALSFSGRGALYAILRDILSTRRVAKAWLPSYCCASMVAPFTYLGINVCFYGVNYSKSERCLVYDLPKFNKEDIVLTMSYFGFFDKGNEEIINYCINNGVTVIEDITHSFLSSRSVDADYSVASLRKWFPVACGGYAEKRGASFNFETHDPDREMINVRFSAMENKKSYFDNNGTAEEKNAYSMLYASFNKCFCDETFEWGIDPRSENILFSQELDSISEKRRQNAKILLDGLRDISCISLVSSELANGDCPLFVPIVCDSAKQLQQNLARNKIYCPMHWPQHNETAVSNMYGNELSLPCDQRYSATDMHRIVEAVRFATEI